MKDTLDLTNKIETKQLHTFKLLSIYLRIYRYVYVIYKCNDYVYTMRKYRFIGGDTVCDMNELPNPTSYCQSNYDKSYTDNNTDYQIYNLKFYDST